MNELILLKFGEIALKGLNRSTFEDALIRNAKQALRDVGPFRLYKAQSTLYAEPEAELDLAEAAARLSRVFGIAALTRARIVDKDLDAIQAAAGDYLRDDLTEASTFKVEAKRSDKKFPLNSPELCRELGGYLLTRYPHLRVDVHNPDVTVIVEIRDFAAYIHREQMPGAGGIPVGTGGRAGLLLSGGIDSPVAGYMMAKRGLSISAIHFASPPYTSERALLKVETLCQKLTPWCGRVRLFTVPFTRLQERIKDHAPEDLSTLLMRRFMMNIASRVGEANEWGGLITGECVGQVASQTLMALACTDDAATLPVLRPVIGMDKEEIVQVARRIDTFETSILPYDDCCTVFTPKHPKTKPRLRDVRRAEERLEAETLIAEAVAETAWKTFE